MRRKLNLKTNSWNEIGFNISLIYSIRRSTVCSVLTPKHIMFCIFKLHLNLIVITLSLNLYYVKCDNPDICYGSPVTAVEKVKFLDEIERYFISSDSHYWFINDTSDLPSGDSAKQLPYGFSPDAALLKDTRQCDGQYTLLLIQVSSIYIPKLMT